MKKFKVIVEKAPQQMKYGGQSSYGLSLNHRGIYSNMADNPHEDVGSTIKPVPRNQANIEAERGETAYGDFDGDGHREHMKIPGKLHSEGGTPLNVPEGTFIYSNTRKMKLGGPILSHFGKSKNDKKKYTPAELAKQYDINKYKAILNDPNSDPLAKKTAKNMMANYEKKLAELALVQEGKKGFPQGIPKVAESLMRQQQRTQQNPNEGQGAPQQPGMAYGGMFNNGGFIPSYDMDPYMAYGGMFDYGGEEMQDMYARGGQKRSKGRSATSEKLLQGVVEMFQQGAKPEEVLQQLVQAKIPQKKAIAIIETVMQQMGGGAQQQPQQMMENIINGAPQQAAPQQMSPEEQQMMMAQQQGMTAAYGGDFKRGGQTFNPGGNGTYYQGTYFDQGGSYIPDYGMAYGGMTDDYQSQYGMPAFPTGGEPCRDAQGNVVDCDEQRLRQLGSDAFTAMQPFYETLYGAANKYANPETGLVSPFNSARATAKAFIKHPSVMFMKRHKLPTEMMSQDPDVNPYHVQGYTTPTALKPLEWAPTDWAEPRRERNTGGGWENFKLKLQEGREERRGRRNRGSTGCWGANCVENEMQDQAMYGGTYAEGGQPSRDEALLIEVAEMIKQGVPPEQVYEQLIAANVPENKAEQIIQFVMEQLQGGAQQQGGMPQQGGQEQMMQGPQGQQAPPQEMMEGQPPMGMYGGGYAYGGSYIPNMADSAYGLPQFMYGNGMEYGGDYLPYAKLGLETSEESTDDKKPYKVPKEDIPKYEKAGYTRVGNTNVWRRGSERIETKAPIIIKGKPGQAGTPGTGPKKDTYRGPKMSNAAWLKFLETPQGKKYKEKYITGTPGTAEVKGTPDEKKCEPGYILNQTTGDCEKIIPEEDLITYDEFPPPPPPPPGKKPPRRGGWAKPDKWAALGALMFPPKLYPPFEADATGRIPIPTLYDPTQALAQNSGLAKTMMAGYQGPVQGYSTNAMATQMGAAENAGKILSDYQNKNVGVANQYADKQVDIANALDQWKAARKTRLADKTVTGLQQRDNANRAYVNNFLKIAIPAEYRSWKWNLMNETNPNFNVSNQNGDVTMRPGTDAYGTITGGQNSGSSSTDYAQYVAEAKRLSDMKLDAGTINALMRQKFPGFAGGNTSGRGNSGRNAAAQYMAMMSGSQNTYPSNMGGYEMTDLYGG